MSKDILSLISSKMNTFSKGQKLIANYILSSYDKAAFMTASKLGKTVHVSESTVVRFASELKYDGYPAMQKALQETIRNKLTSIQRIEVTNDIIGNQDVVSTVMQSDMEKIRLTMEDLGGRAKLSDLGDRLAAHPKAKKNPHFRDRIRATAYEHPGQYISCGNGFYALNYAVD